jgi:pyruvate/2-oxoglutarate dehydrogenase complex dihydrolipoamide acyltransferase (E2) component
VSRSREDGVRRRAEDRARRRTTEGQRAGTDPLEAAKAAAAAAAAGATAGALRALAARRGDAEPNGDGLPPAEEPEEPEAEAEPESQPEPDPVRPAKADELREIAQQARRLLAELRGVDAEAVSGLTRSAEGWVVTLEVVELRRIPESTDVLATYEVEVDEDGRLLRYRRCGRYHRAQADREQ